MGGMFIPPPLNSVSYPTWHSGHLTLYADPMTIFCPSTWCQETMDSIVLGKFLSSILSSVM